MAESDGTFNDLMFRVQDNEGFIEDVGAMNWGDSHLHKKKKVTDAFRGVCTDLGIKSIFLRWCMGQ